MSAPTLADAYKEKITTTGEDGKQTLNQDAKPPDQAAGASTALNFATEEEPAEESKGEEEKGEGEKKEEEGAEAKKEEEPGEEGAKKEESSEEKSEENKDTKESSLHTEDSKSEEKPKEEENKEESKGIDELVADRTESKYSSLNEVLETLQEKEKEVTTLKDQEYEYGNELIARLDHLAKNGVDVTLSFIQSQLINYDSFNVEEASDAKALIIAKLKEDEPGITENEIQMEMEDRYKVNSEEEDQKSRGLLKMTRDARRAQQHFKAEQEKAAMPKGKTKEEIATEAQEKQDIQDKLTTSIKESAQGYEKETFKIGDEDFEYQVSDDQKRKLEKDMLNTDKFFHRYANTDGSIDFGRLRKDLFIMDNMDDIIAKVTAQASSAGAKEIVVDQKNTNFKAEDNKSRTPSKRTVNQQIGEQFLQHQKK